LKNERPTALYYLTVIKLQHPKSSNNKSHLSSLNKRR
jgi:hypothetical protein